MKYWGTPRTRNSQTSTSGRNQNAEEGNMGDNRFQDDETSNKAWEKKQANRKWLVVESRAILRTPSNR